MYKYIQLFLLDVTDSSIAIFVFIQGGSSQPGEAPCHVKGFPFFNEAKSPTISWVLGCGGYIEISD